MSQLTLKGLTRAFGAAVAVRELSFEVPDGALCSLLGPSGSGKTTTMRMVAGLEAPDAGEVWIGDREITRLEPRDRHIGMMFQGYALYPHLSVADNIAYPLRVRGLPRAEREARVREAAGLLGIEATLGRPIQQISGGQQQRVALARAIVQRPELFLLDEPISNLDAAMRRTTRNEIRRVQRMLGTTTVVVTHDQLDALSMADLIAVMNDGALQQLGTPAQVYDEPANTFVAAFLGEPQMNLAPGTVVRHGGRLGVQIGATWLRLSAATAAALEQEQEQEVVVGVRPRALRLLPSAGPDCFPAEVTTVTPEGSRYIYDISLAGVALRVESHADLRVDIGASTHVAIDPNTLHLFGAATRRRLV
ncbi:MAG TPA: ABC transporter ATP-binding protein [Candidatus Dormibacteraeota bacterium]|nr:ABC transporter ATP-binding protein [Candidatus Dormibacteraeota bacterium]